MSYQKDVNAGIRLASMILDHFIMGLIAMVFFLPSFILTISDSFSINHQQDTGMSLSGPLFYLLLIGFALYICKDCINGRSIAKRILKLQVVNNATEEVASPFRCFVRNILCVLWPIEVIVVLISPSKRLGDRIAGTKVVYYDASIQQPKFSFAKIALSFVLAYGLLVILMLPFQALESHFQQGRFVKSSYNASESKSLENIFNDKLGQHLTADVRIYDSVENRGIKYISIIYRLKQNFLESDEEQSKIEQMTNEILYSAYPSKNYTGQAKFVYKKGMSSTVISYPIGKN